MGVLGILGRGRGWWLLERQEPDEDEVDENENEAEDSSGDDDGSDSPKPGPGNSNKGPGGPPKPPGPPSPPGLRATTSTSTTSSPSTTSTTSTTSSSSTSTSSTSSEESTSTTSASSLETTTSTTSTTSVPPPSTTPLPLNSFSAVPIISSSFVAPPVSFSLVSTTAISTTLAASSIPFSTLSPQQTSVAPTITPVVFTPPPVSTANQTPAQNSVESSAQSNGNGFVPSVPSTSVSTSSSTSSSSKSPTAISAAYGISSGKSAPTGTLIGIGVSIGLVTILISGLLLFFLRRRKQQKPYITGNRSTGASQSFWDRVSGLPPDLVGERPAPPAKTSPYAQDFNSYTPFSPPLVQRQFDTSSSDDNVDMPPPALFIPTTMTNAAPTPPPIFTTQPSQHPRPQTPLRLVPNSQPYGTTTTIRTGPLSLSWFLGKPSKIPKPTPQNANFLEPTGYGSNEKVDMSSRITQMEADMREQEQRWEDSRREMANRSSGITDTRTENRRTVQSEGWESGIGDARSARFLSGVGSDTTGRGSFAIQNTRMEYLQPVSNQEMMAEHEKRTIENARRAKWESSPDSLNDLPRWRDPVLSIFEEVRDKTGGPVSPHRVV